jgi:signal transduction histidine kinase
MSDSNLKEKILVADDTPSIAGFIASLLEENGYEAFTAFDGNEAVASANEYRPDLILLDIIMPDIDGYAICSILKTNSKTRDIPVIFMSGLNSSFDKIKAFKSGAVDYITKPIQSEELLARVKSHLNICRLNRELVETNRTLEEKISERTKSLEESNKKMADLNRQLELSVLKYKEAKDKAELAEKIKTEFLANISHEIYTPMNAIVGFTDLVKEAQNESQRNEYLAYIKSNAIKLLSVFNNILDFSQTLTGKTAPYFQKIKISDILEAVYKTNSLDAQAKGLEIVINNECSDGFEIESDKSMVFRILDNLVNNSLKFSDKGKVEIGVSNSGESVVFYIRDSGKGISPELYDKIFKPFESAENFYKRRDGGAGIGLALVNSYVSILKGDIWFDSSPGAGTIFYISIPVKQDYTSPTKNSEYEGVKILVGENEDVAFILLNEILHQMKFNVLRAKTGKQLLQIYRGNDDIALIISNMTLPEINGAEVMKIIRKMDSKIPMIAQIPYFSAQDIRDFPSTGCNEYIDKPANIQQVKEIIKKYVNITKQ